MNYKFIIKIIDIFEKSNLSELEIEMEKPRFKIKLTKNNQGQVITQPIAPIPIETISQANVQTNIQEKKEEIKEEKKNYHVIKSPLVGTFYRAPSPGAEPFVKEGDFVKKGQVLCIIEAMKVMNEIESDVDGIVEKILVENGKPVEYGQELFWIKVSS